ncbi:ArnT family glycosyltransferase [Streptomyces sp. NPDC056707]|uniref:ArnT family glycosyltransferase n=1 Tax=Streptomyces sp. NPDC056707 TaxID=3345919 RepID=UPI0036CB644D
MADETHSDTDGVSSEGSGGSGAAATSSTQMQASAKRMGSAVHITVLSITEHVPVGGSETARVVESIPDSPLLTAPRQPESAVAVHSTRDRALDSPAGIQMYVLDPTPVPDPDPGYVFAESPEHGWNLPTVPASGWSAAASRRRTWVSRGVLACLLLVQAFLSLRLTNTAFEDEALYIYAGHAMIDHLFHGVPDFGGFDSYFSGSPALYPVLAAGVDSIWGLAGVRCMSLLFMLGATVLLYSFTRRLFNERAGLCAAGLFALSQSSLFMGYFATYDAMAVLLLAVTVWIVVRVAHGHWALPLLAVPGAVLAVGVKYASAMFLPSIAVLLVLVAYQRHGLQRALLRGAVFVTGVEAVVGSSLYAADYLQAIESTTTARAHGDTPIVTMLQDSIRWGGLLFVTACLGTVLYARRARLGEVPGWQGAVPGIRWRIGLGIILTGTAVLAPAYHIHLQTSTSLQKHIGYGLLFAAPMAGVGVTRLMGAHFKFPQAAIAVGVLALTLGMSQSAYNYGIWPNTTYLIKELAKTAQHDQKWLGNPHEGPIYYLSGSGLTYYANWTSIFYIDYTGRGGHMSGVEGYRAAIQDGWFDGVVLDWSATPGDVQTAIRSELRVGGRYRLSAALNYQTAAGHGHFEVWLRSGSAGPNRTTTAGAAPSTGPPRPINLIPAESSSGGYEAPESCNVGDFACSRY